MPALAKQRSEMRRFADNSDRRLYAELAKYCGGEGGKPGPCPGPSTPSTNERGEQAKQRREQARERTKQINRHVSDMRKSMDRLLIPKEDTKERAHLRHAQNLGQEAYVFPTHHNLQAAHKKAVSLHLALSTRQPNAKEGAERVRQHNRKHLREAALSAARAKRLLGPSSPGSERASVPEEEAIRHSRSLENEAKSLGLDEGKRRLFGQIAFNTANRAYRNNPHDPAAAAAQAKKEVAEFKKLIPRHKPHSENFSEGGNSLKGVEIFAAGEHRGKKYTPADLDQMVENFKQFSTGEKPGFRVPLVIGHEETQEYLERSDLPAAGWASDVYRDGDKLLADFEDVPEKVARLLRGKTYRTVSSEVYDQPPEDIPGHGKMLRRVALLGGDIPQLKNLEDIPAPTAHSEPRRFAGYRRVQIALKSVQPSATRGAFWCFSEATPMSLEKFGPEPGSKQSKAMWAKATLSGAKNKKGGFSPRKMKKGTPKGGWGFDEEANVDRDSMLQHLAEAGMDQEALKDAPDQALAEMCRYADGDSGDDEDDPDHDDHDDDSDSGGDHEGDSADYADAAGNDVGTDSLPDIKDADQARQYAEWVRKHADHARKGLKRFCSRNAEGDGGASSATPVTSETAQPKKTTVTHQYRERDIESIAMRVFNRAFNAVAKEKMDRFEKFTEQQLAAQKKQTIEAFCEANLKAGKILPFELDDKNPANLFDRLMRADASTVLRKFKENGKAVALTELDLQMREIEQRPVRAFSEAVRGGKAGGNGNKTALDAEVEKIEAAFERFSEEFPKGTKKEDLIAGFKAEKKHHPEVTAEDFLEALSV